MTLVGIGTPPNPSPASECALPPGPKDRGVPIPTTGEKA